MEFNLSTPALLFSAISLLMLAFTNRFLALANLARELHARHRERPAESLAAQIRNLKTRIVIIRNTQVIGVISFFFCALSMLFIFAAWDLAGKAAFVLSLVLLMASLVLSLVEIFISVNALKLQLDDDGR